jgi:hypothetical protein
MSGASQQRQGQISAAQSLGLGSGDVGTLRLFPRLLTLTYFISTGAPVKNQAAWLKKVLASQKFRVRLFHPAKTGSRRPPEIRRQDNQRTDELSLCSS